MNTKPQKHIAPPADELASAKVIGRGLKKDRRVSLQALRVALGKTQADVAEATGMGQGDVSKLESRTDAKVSTLARYASALGGKLEIAITIDGRRYAVEV